MTDMSMYQQLPADLGFGESKMIPKMFAFIADEDEAKLMMAASPPATIAELSEKTGFHVEKVEAMLESLFIKGLIFKSKKPDATRYYKVRHFIQFHDATVLTPCVDQEYLDLWKEFEATEQRAFQDMTKDHDFRQGMRVVPVNVTIEPQNQVLAFEDVKKMALLEAQMFLHKPGEFINRLKRLGKHCRKKMPDVTHVFSNV
jgi:hypothetical protein